jgi:hypothetical protein
VRRLREADIDWSTEPDTVDEAAAELREQLAEALAGLVDPDRLLADVSGAHARRARWWGRAGRAVAPLPAGLRRPAAIASRAWTR